MPDANPTEPSQIALLLQDVDLVTKSSRLAAEARVVSVSSTEHERYVVVVGDLWSKQTAHSRGVGILLQAGLYDSAKVLARAAYETAITLLYLIRIGNKIDNASWYVVRQIAERARPDFKDDDGQTAYNAFSQEVREKIRRDKKSGHLWSGKSLEAMATALGIHGHSGLYAYLCMAVHAREAGLTTARERQLDGSTRLIYGARLDPRELQSLANMMRRYLRDSYEIVHNDFYGEPRHLQTPDPEAFIGRPRPYRPR